MKQLNLLKTMFLLCALIVGSNAWADTVDVTISTYAGKNNWNNGTAYSSISINADVTATGLTNGNNSKYYSSNVSWRHYEGDSGTITIATTNGTLNSVTFTYSSGNSGVLIYGNSNVTTGSECKAVEGKASAEFSVGHSSGEKNGNVQITAISVTYTPAAGTKYSVTYDANDASSGTVPTDETKYDKDASVTVLGNTGSLVKEHYSFGGWNTKADGTGTNYSAGASFAIAANTTLYAKWNINTHNVTMPAEDTYGNYGASATNAVAYGTTVTLTYTPAVGYEAYRAIWSANGVKISGNTFDMPDEDVTVTVAVEYDPSITYDFSKISDFSTWTNSYSEHSAEYDDAIVSFYASKQTGTITDIPVTKGSDVTLTLRNAGETLKSVKFVCRQWGTKAQTITLLYSTDGGENFSAFNPSVTSTNFTILKDNLPTGTNAVKISFSSSSNQVGIESATIEIQRVESVTMATTGLASFASEKALDLANMPEGLTAYKATAAGDGKVTLEKVEVAVPAGTGLILRGTPSKTYYIPVAESGSALDDNLLVGVTAAAGQAVEANTAYALSKTDGKFHILGALTIPQGKAYLPATNLSARELVLSFGEGETTGIADVRGKMSDVRGEYYNLKGQRVAQPTKGLYIVNGKKVVIK